MAPTTILGIDPGLQHTGWGVIQQSGNHVKYVACGVISTDSKQPDAQRLSFIAANLRNIIADYKPDTAAVEEVFVNKNAKSSLKLGQARGIALLLPAEAGLTVGEYAALAIKQAVVGYGKADKEQIKRMVKTLLPTADFKKADAADALAIALTHGVHLNSPLRRV